MHSERPLATSDEPARAERAQALELLRSEQRFVLSGHQRPDGDCLGSQTALARLLIALGKDVWIVNPDAPEPRYAYLVPGTPFRTWKGGSLPEHDVSVFLDFCELSRTGELAVPFARAASKKLVIDHHIHHGERWWDAAYVDVRASATGLLVSRIARELGVRLDAAAATAVFTSLVTDTGWFKYSNTDAETLAVASEMVALGADPNTIHGALYQQRPREHALFVGKLLARTEFYAEGKLALVPQALSEAQEAEFADTDEVLDILRSIRAVEVVLYLRETKSGWCKLSARSKSDYDVNALARRFGGGGHKKASGATIEGSLADVRPRVLALALEAWGGAGEDGGKSAGGAAEKGA